MYNTARDGEKLVFYRFLPIIPVLLLFKVVFNFLNKIGDGKASSKATTMYQWRSRAKWEGMEETG